MRDRDAARAEWTTRRTPSVAVVAEQRHLGNVALTDAFAALDDAGVRVELVVPDASGLYEVPTRRPDWSLVTSRGRDEAGLAVLAGAAALGVPTLNHPRSIELVRNKIAMMATLADHGLPLPRTWFSHDLDTFTRLPAECFPLVVKPYDGDGAKGLAMLLSPADVHLLAGLPPSRLYLAQQYLPSGGWDLKLYGIGARVWAVRKPAPVRFDGAGPAAVVTGGSSELVGLDARLRDIALTCGRACRLDLWGVDVAMTPDGPFVIEVNDFPTYTAVPHAGEHIASLVLSTLEIEALSAGMGGRHLANIVRDPR